MHRSRVRAAGVLPVPVTFPYPAADRCWTCGVETPRDPQHPELEQPHTCNPEDVTRWGGYLEGWQEGYRFAIKNLADPMVQADRVEYGTGWAGPMRTGGIVITGC